MIKRIRELCQRNNVTVSTLEEMLGIGKNSIYKWDKNSPSVDKVKKVATYFGVSIEYLMDETDSSIPVTKPDLLYRGSDGSQIILETKGINTPLSPEQEDKVYKLLEVAMPELIEPEDDDEYIDVYVAARGGNGIQKKKITKKQAERAKKIAEELPDEPTP